MAGRTVVGSGLRAFSNGEALRALGHEVAYCTRTEDLPPDLQDKRRTSPGVSAYRIAKPAPGDPDRMPLRTTPPTAADVQTDPRLGTVQGATPFASGLATPGGPLGSPGNPHAFTETHELHGVIKRVDPDVLLVEALEDVRRLPDGRFAVVLDLFAPRILEQQFQEGTDEREAVRVLDAIQRADWFLFSNERQKYYHLPLLALAGVDCTRDAGGVVPISCPPRMPTVHKPDDPVFVAGGVFWPWADLSQGLAWLLDILDDAGAGSLHLYGGEYGIRSDTNRYADPRERLPASHPRLEFEGLVPIDELWAQYARASVAFDLMAVNPEREINLSFRQIDYLRCGLPIITAPQQVIASDLVEYGAGWVVDPNDPAALKDLVTRLLANPAEVSTAGVAAQRLAAERYAWTRTADALQEFLADPYHRRGQETFVTRVTRTQADLWDDHEENKRLREQLDHQHVDLGKKTEEVDRLNARISTLMGTVDRLTDSLGEVSRFKNEALTYLQEQEDVALREAGELGRELERKALDLHKKQDALDKAHAELDKLKGSITELRRDNEQLQSRYVARDTEVVQLEGERRRLDDLHKAVTSELGITRREVALKEQSIAQLAQNLSALEARFVEKLDASEAAARELVTASQRRAVAAEAARTRAAEELHDAQARLDELGQDLLKKQEELRTIEEARDREVTALEERLQGALARGAEVTGDRDAVRGRLSGAEAELGEARADIVKKQEELRALEEARDHEVTGLEERLQSALARGAEVTGDRDTLRGRLSVAEAELGEARADVVKKQEELRALEEARDHEVSGLEERLQTALARTAELSADRDALRGRVSEARAELTSAKADVAKKTRALQEAARERDRLQHDLLLKLDRAEASALQITEELRDRLTTALADRGRYQARAEELEQSLRETQRQLTVVERDADWRVEELRATAAQGERDLKVTRERLVEANATIDDLREDAAIKSSALLEAARERDRLQEDYLAKLEQSEAAARGLIEDARDRALLIDAERGRLQARIVELEQDLRESGRTVAVKDTAIAQSQADREAAAADNEVRIQEVWIHANRQIEQAQSDRERVDAKLLAAKARIADLEADVHKKEGLLRDALAEGTRLQSGFLEKLDVAEADAKARIDAYRAEFEGRLSQVKQEQERAAAEAERRLDAERQRLTDEAENRISLAREQAEGARIGRDKVREELVLISTLVDDLQADVIKKTEAIERSQLERERLQAEFLANLEHAEGTAQQFIEEARDRSHKLADERARLQGFVEELEARARALSRDIDSRDVALDLAEQRLRSERANFEEVMLELGRLRVSSSESSGRVTELEAEVIRQQSALESLSGELARSSSQLETATFDADTLRSEVEKKSAEVRDAQAERDESNRRLTEAHERFEDELNAARADSGRHQGRLEELQFELDQARRDLVKKAAELTEAHKQRDAAHAEIEAITGIKKGKKKKKPTTKKARKPKPKPTPEA